MIKAQNPGEQSNQQQLTSLSSAENPILHYLSSRAGLSNTAMVQTNFQINDQMIPESDYNNR